MTCCSSTAAAPSTSNTWAPLAGSRKGLPQFNDQLVLNGYNMTAEIASAIINIPAGAAAVNAQKPSLT